ncbi:hypothetical protein [Hydrogenophaga sp.]|uniref:hypothetical protein n=1 Tax=Hydrogenophaga sp. TaxID=1904254 RepID=UPI002734ED85|nr:hypothetical protein [Hydrogenophaga sp.]MDP1573267.1 hypothetical protein [Pseudomonadota bacterium]MDP1959969.1 hypothetical protein [Methylotenera sp.]MDP3321995.1 hypothetical protein [Hydrogenophaga sp.]MDP3884331.1 hypothetical protein [Hydrogenophaga sp.]
MIQGKLEGRVAYGIDTGMGKTESIVALVTAIDQLKLDHVSVLVCQSKVEGLCSLKRKMMDMGVPEAKIGLIHSYDFDPTMLDANGKPREGNYASLQATPIGEQRQFQLVTHSRVRGDSDIARYNTYNDAPRSLAIWDESLLISDSVSINEKELDKAVHNFGVDYRDSNIHTGLLSYLEQSLAYIKAELKVQAEGGVVSRLTLPTIDAETKRIYIKLIEQISGSRAYKQTLSSLMNIASEDLRMLRTGQGEGIVSYQTSIPTELNKVIILDASWWIRELQKLDPSITDESTKFINSSLKKYDHVTVHQMFSGGGRTSLTNDFNGSREQRKIPKEIAAVIKTIPESEGILIFTYIRRAGEPDFIGMLKDDLAHYGINLEQTVQTKVKGELVNVPRVNFLTWGSETSLNEYSYCSNVILAGILHRSHLDIGSSILGQQDNLTQSLSNQEIKRIHDSELAHLAFQALSRGSCRALDNGYARAMKAWIIHSDISIKTILESVMTGVKWEIWDEIDSDNKGVIARATLNILAYLDNQSQGRLKVSTSVMRKELELTNLASTTWTKALSSAMSKTKSWKLVGRSVESVTDFDLLFPD